MIVAVVNVTPDSQLCGTSETTLDVTPSLVFLSLAFLVGAVGNSLVLFVYWGNSSVTPLKMFYKTLAVIGLTTTLVTIPGKAYELLHKWDYGHLIVCKVVKFLTVSATMGSGLVLLAIAVTRYRKICRPFGRQVSRAQVKVITASISITSLVCASPYGVMVGHTNRCGTRRCDFEDGYVGTIYQKINSLLFVCVFLLTSTPTFVMYFLIWKKARNHCKILWNKFTLVTCEVAPQTTGASAASETNSGEENSSMIRQIDDLNSTAHTHRDIRSYGERWTRHTRLSVTRVDRDHRRVSVNDGNHENFDDLSNRSNVITDPNDSQSECRRNINGDGARTGLADSNVVSASELGDESKSCKTSSELSPTHRLDIHHRAIAALGPRVASGDVRDTKTIIIFPDASMKFSKRRQKAPNGTDDNVQHLEGEIADVDLFQTFDDKVARIITIERELSFTQEDLIVDLPANHHGQERGEATTLRIKQSFLGRTSFLLLLICFVLIISFLPFLALELNSSFNPGGLESMSGTSGALYKLFYLSFLINGAANAILYSMCDAKFRRECGRLFCRS